jgi:hypothetical protein
MNCVAQPKDPKIPGERTTENYDEKGFFDGLNKIFIHSE